MAREAWGPLQTLHGEAAECPDFEEWLVTIRPILSRYAQRDIYNADETALFWRMSEGKSFVAANEARVAGRKTSKSRVTLLIGSSMTGEKLPLLCIGSAKKPRWPVVLGKKADAPIASPVQERVG
ncbi:Tigger transposable element-derived protein 6 [Oopsacas minuta]|uniref:Tigger transposable element-derived protein 6 n=1 Tax=Oopsacas minuta TaxID=111878 RepID=A0AAV7JNI7_9METZ|nr:Tigger transposable element-derived protein 6 [Oopsacas minuta]